MGEQVSPVFPVSPSCERHIANPKEGGFTLTNCCWKIIHTTCLASYDTCHICQHDNHVLIKYSCNGCIVDMSTQSLLRERKYVFWQPRCVHQLGAKPCDHPNSCWTYDQSHSHWHVYPHFAQNELADTYFLSPQEFVEWSIVTLYKPNEEACKVVWHL